MWKNSMLKCRIGLECTASCSCCADSDTSTSWTWNTRCSCAKLHFVHTLSNIMKNCPELPTTVYMYMCFKNITIHLEFQLNTQSLTYGLFNCFSQMRICVVCCRNCGVQFRCCLVFVCSLTWSCLQRLDVINLYFVGHLRSCDGTCRICWDVPRRSCTPSARCAPGLSRWSLDADGRCSCSWWAPGSWSSGTVRCREGSDAAARCSTWRCHRLWADENPSSVDSNSNLPKRFVVKCDCLTRNRLCDCSSVQLGRGLCRHRNTTCLYSIYWLVFSSARASMHTLRVPYKSGTRIYM